MDIIKAKNLACPIDGNKLEADNKQWCCSNGHSFDIAKQGYVNLLPVQLKRSKHPGDSKAMVIARRNFLDAAHYQAVASKITGTISTLMSNGKNCCLLDAGCGEGYYFDYLFNHLQERDNNNKLSMIGLDISKEAVIEASKRNKQISWIVGTNRQPPVLETSVDIILCVFGFVNFEGFNKILKPGGKIVLVDAGPDHLKELRKVIYNEVKNTQTEHLEEIKLKMFSLEGSQQCKFKTGPINNQAINNLLLMTPHLFRANRAGKEAASKLQELDLTVDIVIRTLVKNDISCVTEKKDAS